jgi:hypothetical protein
VNACEEQCFLTNDSPLKKLQNSKMISEPLQEKSHQGSVRRCHDATPSAETAFCQNQFVV